MNPRLAEIFNQPGQAGSTLLPARVIEGTGGRLGVVSLGDIHDFALLALARLNEDLAALPDERAAAVALYDAWPYGYAPAGEEQPAPPPGNGFHDKGTPVRFDIDALRGAYNESGGFAHSVLADMRVELLYRLAHFHESKTQGAQAEWQLTLLRDEGGFSSTDEAREAGLQARAYLDGWTAASRAHGEDWRKAAYAYERLRHGIARDYGSMRAESEWLGHALTKMLEDPHPGDPQDPVYTDLKEISIAHGSLGPDGRPSGLALCEAASHLCQAVLGGKAGTYDVGALVLEHAPAGDPAFAERIMAALSRFADAGAMVEAVKEHKVVLDVRKIPNELATLYDQGQISGAAAYFSPSENVVRFFEPPAHSRMFSSLMCEAIAVHEIRHAGRHYNDPRVRIDAGARAPGYEGLAQKLLHVKMIEADAKTFETLYLFQALTDDGTKPIDREECQRLGLFEQFNVLQFAHRLKETVEAGGSRAQAYAAALSGTFHDTLQRQNDYEDAKDFHVLIRDKDFPALWRKTVENLDHAWAGRLTAVACLGGAPYLDAGESARASLANALLKTAERFASKPAPAARDMAL